MNMTERHNQAREIFQKAIEIRDLAERMVYIDAQCRQDTEVRGQVEALLAAHQDAGELLSTTRATKEDVSPEGGSRDEAGEENQVGEELTGFRPAAEETPTVDLPSLQSIERGTKIGPYKLLQQIGEGGMGKSSTMA
jgi:hypothetical protein